MLTKKGRLVEASPEVQKARRRARFRQALHKAARACPEFTADDVWDSMRPEDRKEYGRRYLSTIISSEARAGRIIPAGYSKRNRQASAGGRSLAVWRSLL